jgi:hypothetical protein
MRKVLLVLLSSILAIGFFMPQCISARSVVHINTEAGVSIWLNKELVGKTTKEESGLVIKDLEPGVYNLRAARQGYDAVETQLNIIEDHQAFEWRITFVKPALKVAKAVKRIDSTMVQSKPVGTILLRSIPLNAEVIFNGEPIGGADRKISFAPEGKYAVKFVYQGKELSDSFTLQADETYELTADFKVGKISKESLSILSERGPAVIKMQTARKKKPALFPHRKHQDMWDCEVCHHGMDADGNQTPYTAGMAIQHCVTCHNPKMENKKLNNLMQAAHARCKGCHKKMVADGDAAGPIGKCSGCHKVPEGE